MGLTVYARNKTLNDLYRKGDVYMALFTASGEVKGGGYNRVKVDFSEASNGEVENTEEIRFPIATDNWGEIVGGGVFDAETGGNQIDESIVANKKTVEENEQYFISPGDSVSGIKNDDKAFSTFKGETE